MQSAIRNQNRLHIANHAAFLIADCGLAYKDGIDLRDYIRSGISDESLKEIFIKAIQDKPQGHQFLNDKCIPIEQSMSMIGG